jgi:hypothetical protein
MWRTIRFVFAVLVLVAVVVTVRSISCNRLREIRNSGIDATPPDSTVVDTAEAARRTREPVLRSILISGGSAKVQFSVLGELSPWLGTNESFKEWTVTRIERDSAMLTRDGRTLTLKVEPSSSFR